MIVTAIEEFGKARRKIYLDGQLAFVLYKGELSACHVRESEELAEEDYNRIMEDILWKRIRERCLYLLKSMDRTEYQVRTKLRQGFYPEELIDRAVGWLEKLHYLDDVRYTENYLRSHGTKKSRLQLQQDLTRRGVDTTTIKDGLAQMDDVDEEALIRRWIEKKKVDPENCSPKERQRLYGFLLRKGFSHAQIGKVMRGLKEDC